MDAEVAERVAKYLRYTGSLSSEDATEAADHLDALAQGKIQVVYPCAECGFAGDCGDECHS